MPYQFDVINYDSIQEDALKAHIDRVGVKFYTKKRHTDGEEAS